MEMLLKPPNSWRDMLVRVSVLGVGWVLMVTSPLQGTTRKAGVWLKPPAVLSGGPAAQPNTQGLIPEWGTGGKHCLTPRIGLVELPCPWRKLSKEAGEGGDPVTYFTYSYCLTDKSRAPLICHRWMTAFYIEQQLLIYIYKSCWFYLCPDVWKRKQLSPTSLRGY